MSDEEEEIEVDHTIPQIDRIIRGMEIIRKYETDPYPCAAEHDILYCGSYEDTYALMTVEEFRLMATYGWFESESGWAFFT
jgi:hypothetical protein